MIIFLEIKEFEVDQDDYYIIIASDGVWEFLPNEEIAKIATPFYLKGQPESAANEVVKEAHKKWKIVRIMYL